MGFVIFCILFLILTSGQTTKAQTIDWNQWNTDTSRKNIALSELQSGGPPKDGIPSIDNPKFSGYQSADSWLGDDEPVISYSHDGRHRAYPLQIMIWHEIVNDRIDDHRFLVSFCPLCNSSLIFDRSLENLTLEFGVSGFLRNSDLVMYDRQTETLWQQVTGKAIVGQFTGKKLNQLPSQIISYQQFKEQYPQGKVLSKQTGYNRDYGSNPYQGYDDVESSPFLYDKTQEDNRLKPMERVLTLHHKGETIGYPFKITRQNKVTHDTVAGEPVVVFHTGGAVSALDNSRISESREIGSNGVYSPVLDGRHLQFDWRSQAITDLSTGSQWTIGGKAVSGELKGAQLTPLTYANYFSFALYAFYPEVQLYGQEKN